MCMGTLVSYLKAKEARGKTPKNFIKANCIMQLAEIVSMAKIKKKNIFMPPRSAQARSQAYDAAVHLQANNGNASSRWI